jgi:membrane protease YdiL (CAAX protease family)
VNDEQPNDANPVGGSADQFGRQRENEIVMAAFADPGGNEDKDSDRISPERMSLGGYLAWAAILSITIGMFGLNYVSKSMMAEEAATEASSTDLMQLEMQAKMLIGQNSFTQTLSTSSKSAPTSERPSEESEVERETIDTDEQSGNTLSSELKTTPALDNDLSSGLSTSILDEAERQIESAVSEQDGDSLEADEAVSTILLPTELDSGPYEQRLCYTILVNEIEGVEAAQEHFKKTDERAEAANLELTEDQKQLRQTVETLLENYQAGDKTNTNITDGDKNQLKDKLGWLGSLALVPAGTPDESERAALLSEAQKNMLMWFVAFGIGLFATIIGIGVAIALIAFLASGNLKPVFQQRSANHNIYAETFAIWMAIFFGGQLGFPLVLMGLGITNQAILMSSTLVVFFGSLIALAWPSLRGISFSQTCEDIGWTKANPFFETVASSATYLATLPVMFAAVILVTVLMAIALPAPSPEVFTTGAGPSHPIQEYVAEGGWFLIGFVFVSACIAAPIVEETMFRGVLYHHLRGLTGGNLGRWLSVTISCLLNSFLFAAIHPQGIFGIPMLMTLAIGFSLLREWRGSLLGPVLMHGLNNFLVTSVLFLLM